ncbi:MAG: ABC transporter substrate-binding protein, partial [Candidatus Limnocylindrales bacterium]
MKVSDGCVMAIRGPREAAIVSRRHFPHIKQRPVSEAWESSVTGSSRPKSMPRAQWLQSTTAVALVLLLSATLAACSVTPGATAGETPPSGSMASGTAVGSVSLTHLTVGLGYLPSVQFAPFYLAEQAGYYAAAGLTVSFENQIDPDLIPLVGEGAIDIGIGDGTSVPPAVSQGIPIRYLATLYGTLPNVVFAKRSAGIRSAADLRGKRVGTPCRCGSNWIMLEALLAGGHLSVSDISVVLYPDYGQAVAVAHGSVDAATGYAADEPLQLASEGIAVSVLQLKSGQTLPGPGLIASSATIAAKGPALRAFIAATLRAMAEITADPQRGLDAAIRAVPELASGRPLQLQILQATIAGWRSPYTDAHGLGAIDPAAWQAAVQFMASLPE